MLVAEARQFSELAKSYVDDRIGGAIRGLSELLETAGPFLDGGRCDYRFAAELFVGMLSGLDDVRGLLGQRIASDDENARVRKVVDAFLRCYGQPIDGEHGSMARNVKVKSPSEKR